MSTVVDVNEFDYPDLRTIDPNYTAIEEDVYELKVIKATLSKTSGGGGKEIKPFVNFTLAVVNHGNHSGRRLFQSFWNIQDAGSRDMKDLRKLSDVTGVQVTSSFPKWLEELTQVGPTFKARVFQREALDFTGGAAAKAANGGRYPTKTNPDGSPVMENVVDFRNAQIV